MKDEIVKELLDALVSALDGAGDPCSHCCDCTTVRTMEQSAARFNEMQAFAAAESSKQFVQQQSQAFAQMLKQQAPKT